VVFFRLRMRLRLVTSNHAGLKGRLHIVILLLSSSIVAKGH